MNIPVNVSARTTVLDIAVTTPPYLPFILGCNACLIAPAAAGTGNIGCEVALIDPAAAGTGNIGCEVALIAPAVADTGNSGCEDNLIAPATARCDRVGCGWYIPTPEPQVSGDKIQRILAAINLDGQGQKVQFRTHGRFYSTLWVQAEGYCPQTSQDFSQQSESNDMQAGGYCPRSAYAASIVLFGGQREQ